MSNASNNVLDIGTGRTKHVALPSSCATASRKSEAAATAPEKSKAWTKPQWGRITQPASKRSKAPPKAPITKAIVNTPIPEASESESEEQEPEDNDKSLGSVDVLCQKFTKADKETLQKLLALKKQTDASQRSQAMAGKILFFF